MGMFELNNGVQKCVVRADSRLNIPAALSRGSRTAHVSQPTSLEARPSCAFPTGKHSIGRVFLQKAGCFYDDLRPQSPSKTDVYSNTRRIENRDNISHGAYRDPLFSQVGSPPSSRVAVVVLYTPSILHLKICPICLRCWYNCLFSC
jgi:hypothetical protein